MSLPSPGTSVGLIAALLLAVPACSQNNGARVAGTAPAVAAAASSQGGRPEKPYVSDLPVPVPDEAPTKGDLKYTCTSLGNTFGYPDWVQKDGNGLAVAPDGTCYVSAGWDERRKGGGMYRDGKCVGMLQGISVADGAVAIAGKYVFMGMPHGRGPGSDRGIGRWTLTGAKAPWDGAADAIQDIGPQWIGGACAYNNELFVGDTAGGVIKVYDVESMKLIRRFDCPRSFRMAVANGKLWVIQMQEGMDDPSQGPDKGPGNTVLLEFTTEGRPTGRRIAAANATALAGTSDGRLLVAGPKNQIQYYDVKAKTPVVSGSLGQPGGIYAGVAGAMAPDKLLRPWGVGVDRQGNVYTLGRAPATGGGVDLRAFTPEGKMTWQVYSTQFGDVAYADPASGGRDVYTRDEHFRLAENGSLPRWKWVGYTLDPKYSDGRVEGRMGLNMFIWSAPIVRHIQGKTFVYYHQGPYIGVFRKGPGEILVPSGLIDLAPQWAVRAKKDFVLWPAEQPDAGRWIWTDSNGDGIMQRAEFDSSVEIMNKNHVIVGNSVDSNGDIWLCGDENGIRHVWKLPLDGLDKSGNPRYRIDSLQRLELPEHMTQVHRIEYDAATDTMYLTGLTKGIPKAMQYRSIGSELVCYDHWSTAPHRKWRVVLPSSPSDPNGFVVSMAASGGKVYCAFREKAVVYVYSAADGHLLGHLVPGPEVGGESGWPDIDYGVTASPGADGHTLVFTEDDNRSRILVYDVAP